MTELSVAVLGLTSAAAYSFGRRRLGLNRGTLRTATGRALESLGTTVAFLALNMALTSALVLGAQIISVRFASLYAMDPAWWVLPALLQGLLFDAWRRS